MEEPSNAATASQLLDAIMQQHITEDDRYFKLA